MGTRGPAPKRSEARAGHQRTAGEKKPDKVRGSRATAPPPRATWRPEVTDVYESFVKDDAVTAQWGTTDWQALLIACDQLEQWYEGGKASASQYDQYQKQMSRLGQTDVDRRRSGIEIEREQEEDDSAAEALAELHILKGSG